MPDEQGRYSSELRKAWAHVIAVAWKDKEILKGLRKDPKGTIEKVYNGEINLDSDLIGQKEHFDEIYRKVFVEETIEGYLGIPDAPTGLEGLDVETLAKFCNQDGLLGIMRGT